MNIKEAKVIITGGSSGIGFETARMLKENGATVLISARNEAKLEKAAKELGIMVYPEGGSTFFHNMTMILDGHTSIEHNIPVAPLYDDVLQLWSASKTANTPTLIVNYGSLNGELYWYQHTNVWENEKLLKYTPRSIIDSRSRHRKMAPEEEYENGHILTSKSCKKLVDKGFAMVLRPFCTGFGIVQ